MGGESPYAPPLTDPIAPPEGEPREGRTFRISEAGLAQMRKRALLRGVPIVLLSLGVFFALKVSSGVRLPLSTILVVLVIVIAAAGSGVTRGIKRQIDLMRTFRLTFTGDALHRTQDGLRPMGVLARDVTRVREHSVGLEVFGGSGVKILVPRELEGYEELRAAIAAWRSIEPGGSIGVRGFAVTAGMVVVLFGALYVDRREIAIPACVLSLAAMTASAIYTVRNPVIDAKTKRGAWAVLIFIAWLGWRLFKLLTT